MKRTVFAVLALGGAMVAAPLAHDPGGSGVVLNVITPSAGERAIWAAVALLLLVSSTVVAETGRRATRQNSRDRK